jgi:glucoamylase
MSQSKYVGFVALLGVGAAMAHPPSSSGAAVEASPGPGAALASASRTSDTLAVRAAGPAPDGPGRKADWTEADKTGLGTSRTRRSNVWFTLQRGRMSDAYYPDLSTPSVRSLELVVTDGRTFTDRESTDTRQRTRRPDARSLGFTQVDTAKSGRYRITKRFVTDPRRDAIEVRIRLRSLDGKKYQLYALYDPSLDNSGMNDRGRTVGHTLVATDDDSHVSSTLRSRPAFGATSTGYLGQSDGWTDLKDDHRLDDRYATAGPGNIVQTGRVTGVDGRRGHRAATLTLGFGKNAKAARRTAGEAAATSFGATARRYDAGWHRYVDALKRVPASARDVRRQYLASTLVLAAAEDKQHRGAVVASPSMPWVWGDEVKDLSSPSGAYHLVWSRDAYQFGTAFWAAGDRAAARRIVDWLFGVQQKADGSFPQNSDVAGKPVWGNLQLDEVALPIVLAHLVGRDGASTYAGVKKAADFIAGFKDPDTGRSAPYTPQERWENQSGYSPNSIAAQIAGLVCAADIARKNGDVASANRWLRLADEWQSKVKDWTVTTNGPLSDSPYFLRLTKDGDPNAGTTYSIGDGGPSAIDQREVVDASFLDLVRYGIERPDDPDVLSTLPVIDRELKVTTPNGPFWHRFNHDGYGETRTGGEWTITDPDTFTTLGRGWPLLTGERGEYAVTAGASGARYLKAMAAAAGPSDMLAEQVWDGRPPTGRRCCPSGEGTRSATPLVWSHAGLVRLAWTMQRRTPVDRQAVVAKRYTQ